MSLQNEIMNLYTKGMISDFNVLDDYVCECKESVKLVRMEIALGPDKGKMFEGVQGCKCEELRLAKEVYMDYQRRMFTGLFDKHSLINPNLQKVSFEDYEPTNDSTKKAKEICVSYAVGFSINHPKNILMVGSYGLGKSHLAVSIAKHLMLKQFTCIFISVPKLLTKIRSTYNKKSEHTEDQLLKQLEQVDLLVLDDIGSEQSKSKDDGESWAVSKLFEIIDSRVGKHTIYTTNLSGKELQDRIGPRSFSRMMQDTTIIKMDGNDYRLKDFS